MSLPRTKSVFDAAPLRRAFATVAPPATGMQVDDAPMEPFDVTKCSDAAFDEWLEMQKPNLNAQDQAFEHKRFTNEMMQEWMALTSAATEALVEFAGESYHQSMPPMPTEPYPSFGMPPEIDYDAEREVWSRKQDEIQAHKHKALKLLARARRVQANINFVV